jgi:hypothetical protein
MALKFSCCFGINVGCRKVEGITCQEERRILDHYETKSLIHMENKNVFHFTILLFFSLEGIISFGEFI